ncbi:MAG: hypothetical protein M3R08_00855 [Bacteroidota bacterium]|nr:hypothetical protein [Bacteroidota bacterium]
MEEAFKINDYLPVSFRNPEEQEYVAFLWSSFELNYKEGKYQFAFIAFHMLYMSAVYFNVWQIRRFAEEDFKKAMIGFGKDDEDLLMKATTPFAFSRLNERVIFRFFRLLGHEHDRIGGFAQSVKDRNDAAHCNGQMQIRSAGTLDLKIHDIIQRIDEIQDRSRGTIIRCYTNFLEDSRDPKSRPYIDGEDQVREELIHVNYLSPLDIIFCKRAKILGWSVIDGYEEIEKLHAIVNALDISVIDAE